MNIEQIIEFARGGGIKAAPKKAAAKTGVVAAVAGALGGGCGNGTHQGKRGFQKGNKCAQGRNSNSAVGKASRAHQSARRAVTRHVKAGTLHSAEGKQAVRAAASAHRELQAARDVQKADRAGARRAATAVASGRASAFPAKGTTPSPTPAPAAKPAPHPVVKARVEKSLSEASKAKADRATQHLHDLHTGAKFGAFKPTEIHAHVERIARGTTKDELFAAAKAAGVKHDGISTKKALVEHLKGHAHGLKGTAAAPPAGPASAPAKSPTPKAPPAKAPEPAAKPAPAKTEAGHKAAAGPLDHETMKRADHAFEGSPGAKENFVSLHEFRKRFGGTRQEQDAAIQKLRREGNATLDTHEGLSRPATPEERSAAVRDHYMKEGEHAGFIWISKRNEAASLSGGNAATAHHEAPATKPAPAKAEAPAPKAKTAEKPKAEVAKAEAPKGQLTAGGIHEAFHSSPGAEHNMVPLHELRARLGGTKEEQDRAIRKLRESDDYSLGRREGQHRDESPAERGARIVEDGEAFHYISRRRQDESHSMPEAPAPKAKPAPAKAEAPAPKAKTAEKPKAEATKPSAGVPHDKLKEAIRGLHNGKIDDRQTNPAQVAQRTGVPQAEVEATLRELGAKGAISFDHVSPEKLAVAKGYQTFPVDHEGKPYVGFRIDRPAKFEAATAGHAPEPAAKPAEKQDSGHRPRKKAKS